MPAALPPPDQFWLLTGEVPAGPYGVPQIHAELAAGRATWQTPACPVGGSTWLPLVRTPGIGPAAGPGAASAPPAADVPRPPVQAPDILPVVVPPTPRSADPRPAGATGPATRTIALLLLVVGVGAALYGLYEWVRPLTPTEVCRRLERATTAADAKRYATTRMHPLVDAMFADQSAVDPNDTFEWTQETDGPRPQTRRVGFRGSWLSPEAGRRVRLEGYASVVQDGGWKADDLIFTAVEGQTLPTPGSLVEEHRRNPPPQAAARPPTGVWAYLERHWREGVFIGFLVLTGAWNALRHRPARRPGGTT